MANSTDITYHSIAQSNIPVKEKSALLRLVDRVTGGEVTELEKKEKGMILHEGHAISLGHLVKQNLEAGISAGLMAYADAEFFGGAEIAPKAAMALGAIGSVLFSGKGMETFSRNLSSHGTAITFYSAAAGYFKEKKLASGGSQHAGETSTDEDPIVAAGKAL